MTNTGDSPPVALPAASVTRLADLLGALDEFLRSCPPAVDDFVNFLGRHGHTHPAFTANNLIDELGFTEAQLRRLTAGAGDATV
jgi:hypothetical protein